MTKKYKRYTRLGTMIYPIKKETRPTLTDFGIYVAHGNWYHNLKKLILRCTCTKHVIYWKRYFDSSGNFIGDPKKP